MYLDSSIICHLFLSTMRNSSMYKTTVGYRWKKTQERTLDEIIISNYIEQILGRLDLSSKSFWFNLTRLENFWTQFKLTYCIIFSTVIHYVKGNGRFGSWIFFAEERFFKVHTIMNEGNLILLQDSISHLDVNYMNFESVTMALSMIGQYYRP